MHTKINKSIIGLFVVGAVIISIGSVIIFGTGKLFTEKRSYVLYFGGSIRGLAVGSPVTFRGIKIGSVKEILVRADTKDLTFTFPVFIEIELDRFTIEGSKIPFVAFFTTMNKLIEKGLRAQLKTASLVTGQLMVELDFHPDIPAKLYGHDSRQPEIPTIEDNINELTEKIEKIPVELFSMRTLSIIERIDEALQSSEIKDSVVYFNQIMSDLNKISGQFEKNITPLASNAQVALNDFRALIKDMDIRLKSLENEIKKTTVTAASTMDQATKTLKTISDTTNEDSVVVYQLNKTLEEISAAANAFRSFAEYFEQHPEAFLRGKNN